MSDPSENQHGSGGRRGKRPRKGASVFVYLAVLFAAAFLMLLLAFFIQQRDDAVAGQHTGGAEQAVCVSQSKNHFPAGGRTI